MITHPTVLKIDAEAQQFAAQHRPAAAPEQGVPAVRRRRLVSAPRLVLVWLGAHVRRQPHARRPASQGRT